ncbi:hypothetical protein [Acidovorax cavernicola]|uniref:DUF4198 domain-containing protein n=1 Tax=Acidovorax cavernicola TaxID=1675792 RepID=A0A9X8CY67_9BURK|nr:hypothetical protein [Acidovorax cavernicola]RIX71607.1 hypothetical protein D3H34_31760 [Acidovorax cavernicola]
MTAFRLSRSRAPALAVLALSLSLAASARADYLWLQRDGAQARVFAGEVPKPLAQLPALRDARPVAPEGQSPALETAANHFAFTPAGQGDLRFTATRADADGVLTYFQAKFGRAETKAVNDLELVPTVAGGNTFQLMFKGRPVAASQVNVDTSEGWRRVLTPAKDGSVSFVPAFPGLYVLEVSARVDNGAVTIDGKKYADVRHTATLSFEVAR